MLRLSDCYDEHYFYDYYWPCQHHHAIISQCYYHIMYRHHYLLLPWRPWWWHEFVHMDLYPIENDNQPSNWGHTIFCNEIWGTHEWLSLSPIHMTYTYIYTHWYIINFPRRFFGSNEKQWNGIYIYISYYIYIWYIYIYTYDIYIYIYMIYIYISYVYIYISYAYIYTVYIYIICIYIYIYCEIWWILTQFTLPCNADLPTSWSNPERRSASHSIDGQITSKSPWNHHRIVA